MYGKVRNNILNTYIWQRWFTMTSQSPKSSTSKWQCGNGSLLIKICGTWEGKELGIRATGLTFRELPITNNKSHLDLSSDIASWNVSGRPSPKKTMSGFIIPEATNSLKSEFSLFDSDSVAHTKFSIPGWHFPQSGIFWVRTISRILSAVTLWPHFVQVAVAKEPWHSITLSIPATFSRVSIFCV